VQVKFGAPYVTLSFNRQHIRRPKIALISLRACIFSVYLHVPPDFCPEKAPALLDFLPDSPIYLYLSVFFGPFVQEDAAVAYAATAFASGWGKPVPLFLAIFIGLFLSDIWKYWIGWHALKIKKFGEIAEKKHVMDLKDKVQSYPLTTLFAARFVPLTRIPAYVACGFFHMNYFKFCLYVAMTALVYVGLAFGICHALGAILGENLKWALPAIGIPLVIIFLCFNYWRARKLEQETAE